MNVDIAKKGHSFKGAFAYYLHDKGAETAERVAWAETRNLAHDDPAYAQSVMIATARQAHELKRAAGIKAGRKATAGPVYAFALSWRADEAETLDRGQMIAAAEAALKVLKADHLQAVIVCHQDRDHPHVHVILNRVDPSTGVSESFSKDRDKLDAWADAYERERGHVVSPNRAKKYDDRKKRKQEPTAAGPAKVAPANHPQPAAAKSRAAMLAELQAAQKERHKQEWADLATTNKARRAAVYGARVDFKAIAAQHRAETRPLWSQLGKDHAAERRAFLDRETRISGIVRNAIDCVRSQQIRGVTEDRGFLAMCFNYTLSSQARHAAFSARQNDAKAQLATSLNSALTGKFEAIKTERKEKLAQLSRVYDGARAALIERQNVERGKIRDAWRQIYGDREQGPHAARRFDRARSAANDSQARASGSMIAAPTPSPRLSEAFRATSQESQSVKPEFERASQLPVAKQSPAPAPVQTVKVSTPAPTHSPPGMGGGVTQAQSVPKVDRAAEWAKTPDGARAVQQQGQKAAPDSLRRSFPAPAAPAAEKAASPPRKDWGAAAQDKPREIKTLPPRTRGPDRERER